MAGEIQIPWVTGKTLYALVRNATGSVWQTTTSTFVAYVTANLANYTIAMTEQGTASGYYTGTFPAAAAGTYPVSVYQQTGGSAAEGDPRAGNGEVEWSGTAVIPLSSRAAPTDIVSAGAITTSGGAVSTVTNVVQLAGQNVLLDANNLIKVDVEDIKGTASAGAAGYVGLDWGHITAPTTVVDLSGTTIKNLDNAPPGTLTAAQIATGVWTDTTAGDFTIASSIGKSLYTSGAVPGAAGGLFIAGTNAAVTINGTNAVGGTPATAALTLNGGAASTTSGGTSSPGLQVTGGAGAASTNGAASGVIFIGGGTNTVVSIANGLWLQGSSVGNGLYAASSGSGAAGSGILAAANGTNGNGIESIGSGSGDGVAATAGTTGRGIHALGGSTSGAGIRAEALAGNSPGIHGVGFGTGAGIEGDGGANGDGMKLVHSGTGNDLNATTTNLVLAKTTNITGFNDIAATAIVSGGAITTSGGAVSSVTTVTNLTNLPAIPTNWLTAAGIAAAALNGKGDWLLASSYTAPDNADIVAIKAKTDNLPASPAAVGSPMTLDLTQAVPTSNTAQTVGDSLNAARAQGFGKWTIVGTTLTLYASDGTTAVRTFTLDSATAPTSRT